MYFLSSPLKFDEVTESLIDWGERMVLTCRGTLKIKRACLISEVWFASFDVPLCAKLKWSGRNVRILVLSDRRMCVCFLSL